VLRGAFVLWALLSATPACAQVSGSATLLSDYRYRGISLSDGQPAAQLSVAYDLPGGAYAGVLASSVRFAQPGGPDALLLPYVGYAHRLRPGLTWEVGAQYSRFVGSCDWCYAEWYAGLSSEHFGGRIYYAHDYFGRAPTVYAELNGTHVLSARLRALGHIGALRSGRIDEGDDTVDRYRYDLRIGFALTLRACEMQLTWGTTGGGDGFYSRDQPYKPPDRNAWVFALSHPW